jgi:hypothetical protein
MPIEDAYESSERLVFITMLDFVYDSDDLYQLSRALSDGRTSACAESVCPSAWDLLPVMEGSQGHHRRCHRPEESRRTSTVGVQAETVQYHEAPYDVGSSARARVLWRWWIG